MSWSVTLGPGRDSRQPCAQGAAGRAAGVGRSVAHQADGSSSAAWGGSALVLSLYRTGEVHQAQAMLAETGVLAEEHGENLTTMVTFGCRPSSRRPRAAPSRVEDTDGAAGPGEDDDGDDGAAGVLVSVS